MAVARSFSGVQCHLLDVQEPATWMADRQRGEAQRGTPKQGSTPRSPKSFLKCTISREGTPGNWTPRNAFSVKECGVVAELLTLPSLAAIRSFEYL